MNKKILITTIFILINNIPLYALEETFLPIQTSPLVSFCIQFRIGSIDDPRGKEGLSYIVARMIKEGGTKDLSSKEIISKLYPLAVEININIDKEFTTFSATVPVRAISNFYPIFRDLLIHPKFDTKDFERVRSEQLNFLKFRLRMGWDEELGKEALQSFIYEDHPYSHPVVGTIKGINNITLSDIREFYKKHYGLSNLHIGIAGGYDSDLPKKIKEDFSILSQDSVKKNSLPKPKDPNEVDILLIEKPSIASAISIGFSLQITRTDSDFIPLLLANVYFGDHRTFSGVLMNKLRIERGLNYGDYSYIEHFVQDRWTRFTITNIPRQRQYFSIWIRPVQPENAHFSIRLALLELKKLVDEGLSEEAFQTTKRYLLNYSKLWKQTQSRSLGFLMDSKNYGVKEDLINAIEKHLPILEREDVNKAIKRNLQYRNIKIVCVGPEMDKLKESLLSNSPSPIYYQGDMTSPETLKEDKIAEVYPLSVKRVIIIPADKIFERDGF